MSEVIKSMLTPSCISQGSRFTIFHTSKDTIKFAGIDIGPAEVVDKAGDDIFLVKRKGHQTWAGIGLTTYAATEYYLVQFERLKKERNITHGRVVKIMSAELGRKVKTLLPEFIEYFKNN